MLRLPIITDFVFRFTYLCAMMTITTDTFRNGPKSALHGPLTRAATPGPTHRDPSGDPRGDFFPAGITASGAAA